ncbi:methyltransferase [candidate division WWE3 bacterium]|uniref:Methyltransferase n=1 Tax=candidate division WWE3 bacterium TaxID=2053526 RepID=A0A7X9DLA6_UNCKA|nr:methyltransferase [candidate division WWE3 bacterium]
MNIQRNRTNPDGDKRYVTTDLPIVAGNVALYRSPTGDYVIQKFGKEFPELYVGIGFVVKELKKLQARSVVVREGGAGIVPTLFALALPGITMHISLWSANRALLDRNLEENINRFIGISVEKDISHRADVCVLVHESYQSQASVVEEVVGLINASAMGILYVISHKNKGVETLAELITKNTGIQYEIVERGKGGARVLKFASRGKKATLQAAKNSYTTFIGGTPVTLETGSDAFSKNGVDTGSAMLVKYLSSCINSIRNRNIWDLGCGTGYLGIAAALLCRNAYVVLSDVNTRVLEAARSNVTRAGIASRVQIVLSDGPQAVQGEFDLILSNPPLHIPKQHLIWLLTQSRRKLVKGGKMLLVVEDSRVKELRELLEPSIGVPRIVFRGGTHDILEIDK